LRPRPSRALAPGALPQLRGLVLRGGPQLGGIRFRCRLQLVRRRAGFLDDLCDLLLGEAQQLLDLGTRPGITRAFPLPQLADLGFQLPDVLIELMPVIAADHHVERLRGCLPGDVTGLATYPGIHTLTPSITREAGGTSANAPVCRGPAGLPARSGKLKRSLSAWACAAGLSPGRSCRVLAAGSTGTLLGAVTHAYRGQLAEV